MTPDKSKQGIEDVIEKVLKDDLLPNGAKKWVLHGSHEFFIKALSPAIKEYYLGLLPKEEALMLFPGKPRNSRYSCRIKGRNTAIQEMREKITK